MNIQEPTNKQDYYYIPNVGWLPRVTNILKIIAKGEKYDEWLRNQGQNSKAIMSEAGDIGTSIHNRLEEIGKGIPMHIEALKPLERKWVGYFNEWRNEHISSFITTERPIHSVKERYAGTLDSIVTLKDKRIALLDYKTSKYIYDTHELQCCAYIKAYEEMVGTHIDTSFILRFDKNSGLLQVKEIVNIDAQYEVFLHALKLWYWKYGKYQEFLNEKEKK